MRWADTARSNGPASNHVFLSFARHVVPREVVVRARKYGLRE
jgi:hypothetical protein